MNKMLTYFQDSFQQVEVSQMFVYQIFYFFSPFLYQRVPTGKYTAQQCDKDDLSF